MMIQAFAYRLLGTVTFTKKYHNILCILLMMCRLVHNIFGLT